MTFAQETWTMDQFLLDAYQSPSQKFQTEKLELLSAGNYRLPLIENLQFRTETRDFDLEMQEYGLRLNTNSFRSINNQGKLLETEQAISTLHQSILLKNELANRYNILLSLIFQRDKLTLTEQKLQILNDKLSVLKASSSWELPKVKELIKVEQEIIETEIKKLNLVNGLEKLNKRISQVCNKEIDISTDDIIAARFIREHFQEVILADSMANKQMEMAKLKVEKNNHELNLEKNKNRKIVKFYQLGYRGSDDPFDQTQFRLGIGINLPFRGSGKLDEAELAIKNLELQSDVAYELDDLRQEQFEIVSSLESNILTYETLQAHYDKSLANKTLEKYRQIPDIDAMSILYLKENDLNRQEQLMQAEFNLYKDYIDSIEIFDLLDKKPFRNFLSVNHLGF